MIRIDLARAMAERIDITLKDADNFLTVFMQIVGETLEKGEKLQLVGFGLFDLRYVPEHQGRNPKTGEVLTIPACHYPIFKSGKVLKDRVAKGNQIVAGDSVDPKTEDDKAESSGPVAKPARKKKHSTPPEELV